MSEHQPAIILVRPQMGENIGAAARAMLNFGLSDLRLVAPRDEWPNQHAFDMSSGALVRFEPTLYETLSEALSDCHYSYATTARTRDMAKTVYTAENSSQKALTQQKQGQKVAFIFGPERTGLENEDLALCNTLITIPTNPDFASINLGQSVLLICYQYFNTKIGTQAAASPPPAEQKDFEALIDRLEHELEVRKFFRDSALKPSLIRNIRNLFLRTAPTDQEVRTLHGIISALIGNKTQE